MRKALYTPPKLSDFGDIGRITGAMGSATMADVLVDIRSGRSVTTSTGSFDQCIKRNDQSFAQCDG